MYEDQGLDAFMEDQISGHQLGDDVSEFADEPDCDFDCEPREDHFRDDVEADADTLRSAGWGTDEDYEHGDGFFDDGGE